MERFPESGHWRSRSERQLRPQSGPTRFADTPKKFYVDVLGFKVQNDIPLGEHHWLTVVSTQQPDGPELLLEPSSHAAISPYKNALVADGIPAHSFEVENLDAECKRLRGLDVKFAREPVDAGSARMAVFDDTCGNLIQIVEMKDRPQN